MFSPWYFNSSQDKYFFQLGMSEQSVIIGVLQLNPLQLSMK